MANTSIQGKRVAFLLTDGVEQIELTSPWEAVQDAGGTPVLVSPKEEEVQGFNHHDKGDTFVVDVQVKDARVDDFDALVIPGGVVNGDQLRGDADAVDFTRGFFESHKPVASICHGPWVLIEAGATRGRQLTSYHTLQTDLRNAGATWIDDEVVTDNGLVTSRNPGDLPAFNDKMLEEIAEGEHAGQRI